METVIGIALYGLFVLFVVSCFAIMATDRWDWWKGL